MEPYIKLIILCALAFDVDAQLPPYITPCSQSLPIEELSACLSAQAKNAQQSFAKGVPELGLEPLDPLSLNDISANAGTFSIKSNNVVVKGLGKMEIKQIKWNLQKMTGVMKIYGNLTFTSDYQTDGRILLIPISGSGKLTVKMYDTDFVIKFRLRKIIGPDGAEHMESYDLRHSEQYRLVNINMSNILGGAVIGDTINQVLNDNWRELMTEVGPPYAEAVVYKVHDVINKFYLTVPLDQMLAP